AHSVSWDLRSGRGDAVRMARSGESPRTRPCGRYRVSDTRCGLGPRGLLQGRRPRPRVLAAADMRSVSSHSEPGSAAARIRGVLFDLDGTLYAQAPLRILMAGEFAFEALRAPRRTRQALRIIECFRRTREELRDEGDAPPRPLDALQFERTASRLGVDV